MRSHRARSAALAAGVLAAAGGGTWALSAAHGDPAPAPTTTTATSAQAAAPACSPLTPGTRRLTVAPGRVPVVVHVPAGLRPGAPLVLGLPGAGQTAADFATYTGFSRLADRERFVVAYPTATGRRPFWNITDAAGGPDDVAYLRTVIGAVVRATCADADRVGVTGVSNGGGMSARLACDASDLVAAAAPVAGGYGSLPDCRPGRPVPVLEIHGTGDTVVPYAGRPPDRAGAVSRFLAQWRGLDGCHGAPATSTPAEGVTELRSTGCARGTEVVHDRVAGAQHGWPGEDRLQGSGFHSTSRVWRFLSAFRRS